MPDFDDRERYLTLSYFQMAAPYELNPTDLSNGQHLHLVDTKPAQPLLRLPVSNFHEFFGLHILLYYRSWVNNLYSRKLSHLVLCPRRTHLLRRADRLNYIHNDHHCDWPILHDHSNGRVNPLRHGLAT